MASFYSPYQSHPDYGQGIGDIANQIIQFMLMKKYMGGMGGPTTTQQATTALPPQTGAARVGAQGMAGMAPAPFGNMGQGGMDPQMLKQLAQALGIDLTQFLGR